MSNQEVLQEYSDSIKNLKKQCIDAGMSEEEFKLMYFQTLKTLENNGRPENNTRRSIFKYFLILLGVFIVLYTLYYSKAVYSSIVCNLQEYIYPGLKLLRRLSIPFISLFPSLTEYYHETCLIQNPYFAVVDMDCWPCSTVNNIREVNDPIPVNQQQTAPFIYETEQQVINMEALKKMYTKNKNIFDKESPKILTNNKYYISPDDLFNQRIDDKNFYIWKFNNMNVAKLLRQIIPRPKVVPKFGQSTERFIIVDSSQQTFNIPDTECSFSFLLALSGSREINLVPAEECKHQCKSLKLELKETYLLWYNWWYWRPAVQQSMGNHTFIAHVGSYC
ncbi:uncharacterized protein LOC113508495 [Trichoplusia ni]|uniref:Uncharacterized protein LOC113508495 n=1 Tax=Trichoplusia ni TaxID=7111 RepID=A0A7E5X3Z4_TRINI|nr:uncharacterized protein LOC113508495 [Trichoplusia ni]